MDSYFYKIEALTNMHVGSGDANYGVVDNLVQRDVVTELPTINGSSLKGALREFFENSWGSDNKIVSVFGNENANAGCSFLGANLLAIPVRSNNKAYFLATAPMVLKRLEEDFKNFGIARPEKKTLEFSPEKGKPIVFTDKEGLLIEDYENDDIQEVECPKEAHEILGEYKNLVILHDSDFKELCNDTSLPVIARNRLGENKNLWYEQVVPSKSLFWFVLLSKNLDLGDFNSKLFEDDSVVHIGANATVGYGFSKISNLIGS